MAKLNPADVRYLSLEGGGGKGVTFLGAIREMERTKVDGNRYLLPIKLSQDQSIDNPVKGISGASAGAITAFFLSIGWTSEDIERELERGERFIAFFDNPRNTQSRAVSGAVWRWQRNGVLRHESPASKPLLDLRDDLSHAKPVIDGLMRASIVWPIFIWILSKKREQIKNPILKKISESPTAYLYNLLFDKGIFPGFEVRKYFKRHIDAFINKVKEDGYTPRSEIAKRTIGSSGERLRYDTFTFAVMEDITSTRLAVTGANITTKRPEYFSSDFTPDFPVGESIAISMNLPFLFKPVYIDYNVHPDKNSKGRYKGLWVDGGLLNNLPMHYFDDLDALNSSFAKLPNPDYSRPLNKNMLALRLTPGYNPPRERHPKELFDALAFHVDDIVETLLYPAEAGQIRTPEEKEQTIELYTHDLETTDFSPSAELKSGPIREAQKAVTEYFKQYSSTK